MSKDILNNFPENSSVDNMLLLAWSMGFNDGLLSHDDEVKESYPEGSPGREFGFDPKDAENRVKTVIESLGEKYEDRVYKRYHAGRDAAEYALNLGDSRYYHSDETGFSEINDEVLKYLLLYKDYEIARLRNDKSLKGKIYLKLTTQEYKIRKEFGLSLELGHETEDSLVKELKAIAVKSAKLEESID